MTRSSDTGPSAGCTPVVKNSFTAPAGRKIRATCVMARGFIDSRAEVLRYIDALALRGVREFTFKHTYVAYPRSVFAGSPEEMVTALIEYRGLSADEAERIRTMIDQSESSQNAAAKRKGRKS